MIKKYLLEFMGSLLICATMAYTNSMPIAVGLAHTSALYIGKEHVEGHFSPLNVIIQYSLGRLSLQESVICISLQILAALSVAITFIEYKM
jgi:hypothetical protein